MIFILKNEFLHSFKSFKSIVIILFFTVTSFLTASYLADNASLLGDQLNTGAAYTSSIKFLVFFLGFLFVFSVSHDLINRELDYQTIRLLVTKTSKLNIIIGKFLGVLLFWLISISISFIIISFYAHDWFMKDYITTIVVLFFMVSFVTFFSTIIPKPSVTMFLGILIGILAPILGFWAVFSDNWFLIPFKFLLPYYYVVKSNFFLIIPLLIGVGLLLTSYLIFKRKDL
jgi:ABC-2 type transport system permease protein